MVVLKRLLVFLLCLGLLGLPVRAEDGEKLVALTFDDGPSGRYTEALLDGLRDRGVEATFLLCGYRMAQYPELTRRIFQEGHEIGLHGYSHKPMQNMCRRDVLRELGQSMALVPEGCRVAFLRAPGGASGKTILSAAEEMGLSVLGWSVDPRDWATRDAAAIEASVLRYVGDGDVILLHDMSDSSVEAALVIIDRLREQGFRFVTVSHLARERSIRPVPGEKYTRFG